MRCQLFRLGLAVAVTCTLLLLGDINAQPAGGGKHDPVGEPKGFKAGESMRYAVWYTKKGWHVRTTTAKKEHHFTGKIWVEGGVIQDLEPHDLEHKGKFGDWWKIDAKNHEIVIDFKTKRDIDGINFQVSKDARLIHFNLLIDGKHHADKIYIGHDNHHPTTDPFNLPAHPNLSKK